MYAQRVSWGRLVTALYRRTFQKINKNNETPSGVVDYELHELTLQAFLDSPGKVIKSIGQGRQLIIKNANGAVRVVIGTTGYEFFPYDEFEDENDFEVEETTIDFSLDNPWLR